MWRECFLVDPDTGRAPARDYLDGLTDKSAAAIVAVVMAVRDAPPPAFSGGGKWEALHGEMSGFYEVRVRSGQSLHRLFCILARSGGQGTLLMVSGGSKPNNRKMPQHVYGEALRLRDLWAEAAKTGTTAAVVDC